MAESVFPHKDLAKLSLDFVAVIAHNRPNHGEGEWIVGGKKKHMCNIYDVSSCKAHEDMSAQLQRKNLLKGVRGTPTHIMFNPHDLSEISRAHGMSVGKIEDAVKGAQKKLGKPILWKEYGKMKGVLDTTHELTGKGDLRGALKAIKGFDAKGIEALENRAKELKDAILEAGNEKLEEAKGLMEEGANAKALKILRNLSRDFSGTDLGKEAKALIAEAKKK